MKSISGKKFCKMLEERGWVLKRINGSHHIYFKSGGVVRISVPVNGNSDLKIGLLKSLLKSADIDENEIS